jgi:RNA polymerase sigma factor (TIGR02999 family)
MPDAGHEITVLLEQWAGGDLGALDRLAPLVYPQLQSLANSYFRRERAGHTWEPTVLVNELFLKLFARRNAGFVNRQHFYNACAKIMRQVLIDHAREVRADKRGAGMEFLPLHDEMAWLNAAGPQMIDFDRALGELEALDAQQVQIFEMRVLLGAGAEETAKMIGVSKATVDRKMRMARAWLHQRLAGRPPGDSVGAGNPPTVE